MLKRCLTRSATIGEVQTPVSKPLFSGPPLMIMASSLSWFRLNLGLLVWPMHQQTCYPGSTVALYPPLYSAPSHFEDLINPLMGLPFMNQQNRSQANPSFEVFPLLREMAMTNKVIVFLKIQSRTTPGHCSTLPSGVGREIPEVPQKVAFFFAPVLSARHCSNRRFCHNSVACAKAAHPCAVKL